MTNLTDVQFDQVLYAYYNDSTSRHVEVHITREDDGTFRFQASSAHYGLDEDNYPALKELSREEVDRNFETYPDVLRFYGTLELVAI